MSDLERVISAEPIALIDAPSEPFEIPSHLAYPNKTIFPQHRDPIADLSDINGYDSAPLRQRMKWGPPEETPLF